MKRLLWAAHLLVRRTKPQVTLVIQGYSRQRAKQLCRTVCEMSTWDIIEAALVVWNGERQEWPGCNACQVRERASWELDVSKGNNASRYLTRIHFSDYDLLDNHYAVPALIGIPSKVALIMDDDVRTTIRSVSCLLNAWRGDPRVIVSLRSSARGSFSSAGKPRGRGRNEVYCTFLPQLVLIPLEYLKIYARFSSIRALVNRTNICEDYAFGSVVGNYARMRYFDASMNDSRPSHSPDVLASLMLHVVADGAIKIGGDEHTKSSLSGAPGHTARRHRCPLAVQEAIASDLARMRLPEDTFIPSTLSVECGRTDNAAGIAQAREAAAKEWRKFVAKFGESHALRYCTPRLSSMLARRRRPL